MAYGLVLINFGNILFKGFEPIYPHPPIVTNHGVNTINMGITGRDRTYYLNFVFRWWPEKASEKEMRDCIVDQFALDLIGFWLS